MERPGASYRRGSRAFPSRRSVSWTVKHEDSAAGAGQGQGPNDGKEDKQARPGPPSLGDGLGKEIGLLYGGSLVVNAIIGPGIFGTPKGVLAGVGSVGMCMVMWVFAGIFSMCAALCFAELRESVKREGVEYAYITEAFGPLAGFVYSWMRIAAAEPCSTAVFALAFTDYVSDVIYDDCGPPEMFVIIVATLATLSMALVNVMSTKLSERVQMIASVGKVAALSTVVVIGIMRMIQGRTDTINSGFQGSKYNPTALGMACYNGLWAFGGWSNVNQVTSGIKKPPRNVPRVIKFILPFVLVLYILDVLSFFTTMTTSELLKSQAIGVTWAERTLGPASSLISVSVGLICLGSLNATFLSAGRLSGVAARNGQMPDVVSWVHVSSKTPLLSVCFRCVVAILLVCVATGQELLRFNMFTVWLFHGSSILALLILRFKNKDKKRPYKVDLWIPVLVVTITCFLLLSPFLQAPERTFIVALVLIALSLLSYHPINWLKSKDVINVPDKLIVWLQLFFRVAPKRDLRREKRSIIRRMSMFARDSILITPNVIQSPEQMRRFSRRMSRISRRDGGGAFSGSPALIRRLSELESESALSDGLRRRHRRGSSMAEADRGVGMKKWRSNSMWAFKTDSKPSPAIIRKKPSRGSQSFTQADMKTLPSPLSLPILKNRFNTTPEASENSAPGALAPPTGGLQIPHPTLRPVPSPIPEEEFNALSTTPTDEGRTSREVNVFLRGAMPSAAETDRVARRDGEENVETEYEPGLEVVADFESDGGREYEVLAPTNEVMRRMPFDPDDHLTDGEHSGSITSCSSDDDSVGTSKSHESINVFKSLFTADSSSPETSSIDESGEDDDDNDIDNDEYPTLPMFYYDEDELATDSSGSDNEGEYNIGYEGDDGSVESMAGGRGGEQSRRQGEESGAREAGFNDLSENRGDKGGGHASRGREKATSAWHANPAFYVNIDDRNGEGSAFTTAAATAASAADGDDTAGVVGRVEKLEDQQSVGESDGGIQMRPVDSPSFARDTSV